MRALMSVSMCVPTVAVTCGGGASRRGALTEFTKSGVALGPPTAAYAGRMTDPADDAIADADGASEVEAAGAVESAGGVESGVEATPEFIAELEIDERTVATIEAEEAEAARRRSAIEAGRRKGGLAGAAMAGVMLGLRDIYEGPPKDDEIVVVSEAPGDPDDIDTDGIRGRVDDIDYWAPPPG